MLEVSRITCGYAGKDILSDVSFSIQAGEKVAILGPNGAGKSTLVKALSRVLKPSSGSILLNGDDLYGQHTESTAARAIAVAPQDTVISFDFTVREMVAMGRHPHVSRFQRETSEDLEAVESAMKRTGVWEFRDRLFPELSGGERQRVILARALAQSAQWLILDEPTAHLDLKHRIELMRIVAEMEQSVIAVVHDLNLTAPWFDRILLLHDGQVVADGVPDEVLTSEILEPVYELPLERFRGPQGYLILPKHEH